MKPGANPDKTEAKLKGKAKRSSGEGSAAAAPASAGAAGGSTAPPSSSGRRPGPRGSAPWAARHAAKHAAEARARSSEPALPGSARASLRVPEDSESIKAKIGTLHADLVKIRGLRKNLNANFYAIGQVLRHIQDSELYTAKGYASFEAFAEREIDLGRAMTLRLVRIPALFQEAAAAELGLEALLVAVTALEEYSAGTRPAPGPAARPPLPMKPPGSTRS